MLGVMETYQPLGIKVVMVVRGPGQMEGLTVD